MTQATASAGWEQAAALLAGAEDVVLLGHVVPDADALGSALAMGMALRTRGARVRVSFGDDPFVVPRSLRWLPGGDLLVPPHEVLAAGPADVVASFDVSDERRLGVLVPLLTTSRAFLAVDHHASFTGFGTLQVVDPGAEATAVMVLRLLDLVGASLTTDIATCLYAGLATDTGSFRFRGTSASTHEVAARLLGAGAPPDLVARQLFDSQPFGALRLLGTALAGADLDLAALGGAGVLVAVVTREDRDSWGLPLDAVENVVDVLRSCSDADVAVVLKQDDEGRWRVSARSHGRTDVGAACVALGGGGHRSAAGATLDGPVEDAVALVRAALEAVAPAEA
jgi:phosphoesterase RecJ-like protein